MISKEELIARLKMFGLEDVALEVEEHPVDISDYGCFLVHDVGMETMRGEIGYGTQYMICDDEVDGKPVIAVYSKPVEPEGHTVLEYGDPWYYDLPTCNA